MKRVVRNYNCMNLHCCSIFGKKRILVAIYISIIYFVNRVNFNMFQVSWQNPENFIRRLFVLIR